MSLSSWFIIIYPFRSLVLLLTNNLTTCSPPVGLTGPDLGQWKNGEDNITKYFIWYVFRRTHLLFYPTGENGCLHAGAQGYPCDQYCQQVLLHPQAFKYFFVKKLFPLREGVKKKTDLFGTLSQINPF